uniref:Uncharacterized protein n=1 Tax=Cannabis sativa TaxID=3483 RepID=A0A803P4M7_CANSA
MGLHHEGWPAVGGTLEAGWPMPVHRVHGRPLVGSWDLADPLLAREPWPAKGKVISSIGLGRTKQSYRSAPPSNPHVSRVVTIDRVGIVEEATQPLDDRDPEVSQEEVHVVNQGAKSLETESEVEEALPAKRRMNKTYVVFSNSPLCLYDDHRQPLNRLDQASMVRLDRVLV